MQAPAAPAFALRPPPAGVGMAPDDADLPALLQRLQRVHGPGERRALLLALLLSPDNPREQRAWAEETRDVAQAASVRAWVVALPAPARLPVLEQVLARSAPAGASERTELLRSARRVMCADGRVHPLDRLRWLLMRHLLAGSARQAPRPVAPAQAEQSLADLPASAQGAIARLTASLARSVPQQDAQAKVGTAGVAWYRAVLRTFWFHGAPACQVPDADQLVQALQQVQALSWMQRPVLTRTWVHAAVKVSQRLWRGEPLALEAAETLRIATRLLDVPLHPALSERFIDPPGG